MEKTGMGRCIMSLFSFYWLGHSAVMCHIRKEHFSYRVACLAIFYFDWMKVGPVILNLQQLDSVVVWQRKWSLERRCAWKWLNVKRSVLPQRCMWVWWSVALKLLQKLQAHFWNWKFHVRSCSYKNYRQQRAAGSWIATTEKWDAWRGEKVWIADKCGLLNLFQIVLLLSQCMWCETNKRASPVVSRKTKKKAQASEGKFIVWNQLWMLGIMKWRRIW